MAKFVVDFEFWVEVEANNEEEAMAAAMEKVNLDPKAAAAEGFFISEDGVEEILIP